MPHPLADKAMATLELCTDDDEILDVAIRCWTDTTLEVNTANVTTFLKTMGPIMRAQFIEEVTAYAAQ